MNKWMNGILNLIYDYGVRNVWKCKRWAPYFKIYNFGYFFESIFNITLNSKYTIMRFSHKEWVCWIRHGMFSHFHFFIGIPNYEFEDHSNYESSNIFFNASFPQKLFLSTFCVPDTFLNAENIEVNNGSKTFYLHKANILIKGSRQ